LHATGATKDLVGDIEACLSIWWGGVGKVLHPGGGKQDHPEKGKGCGGETLGRMQRRTTHTWGHSEQKPKLAYDMH